MSADDTHGSRVHPLYRNRDFALLVGGHALSTTGDEVSAIALPLLVLALTESASQAGGVAAFQAVPYLLLSLPAGVWIDRWNRKTVMMAADGVRAVALLSVPLTYALGILGIPQLYAVAWITGCAYVFFNVAQIASFERIVPEAQRPRAVSVNEAAESAGNLLGPGLGGVIVGLGRTQVAGAVLAYLVDAITFVLSAASLGAIRRPLRVARDTAETADVWRELREGFLFFWRHRELRAIAATATALNFLFAPSVLAIIVLARDELEAPPGAIGLIFSIGAVGGIAGSLLAPALKSRFRISVGHILVGSVFAWALGLGVLPAASTTGVLAAGWVAVAFVGPFYEVFQLSYRLSVIPPELQGRVHSSFRFLPFGVRPLSLALGGIAIETFGPRPTLTVLAIGMLLTAVAVARSSVRKL